MTFWWYSRAAVINNWSRLTWGMRCRKASPLSVPTASATRKLRRNLKKTLFMSGMRTTPSRERRLMMVIETKPPTHAATRAQEASDLQLVFGQFQSAELTED